METLVNKLLVKMQEAFRETAGEENLLRRYKQNIQFIKGIIKELRDYASAHPFRKKVDEIKFFKSQAPPFYSQYFYYNLLLNWELFRLISNKDRQLAFLEAEMVRTSQFFELNAELVRYYYIGGMELDEQLFTCKGQAVESWVREEMELVIDDRNCIASITLARIIAFEQYQRYLQTEIDQLRNPAHMPLGEFLGRKFEFDDTNAAAVEWISSFGNRRVIKIDGIGATTKTLARLFESAFRRNIGDVHDVQCKNANRKIDQTPFLNSLIRALIKKDPDN